MKISLLNERITIEKNTTVVDSVGNHINTWEEHFSCAAYAAASSYKQKESETAGIISAEEGLVFTVRYCSELSALDSTHYRVKFHGDAYNITSVDMVNYGRKSIKISCSKEVRS